MCRGIFDMTQAPSALTLNHTKALIEQCIDSFLESFAGIEPTQFDEFDIQGGGGLLGCSVTQHTLPSSDAVSGTSQTVIDLARAKYDVVLTNQQDQDLTCASELAKPSWPKGFPYTQKAGRPPQSIPLPLRDPPRPPSASLIQNSQASRKGETHVFRLLERYISMAFASCEDLNISFSMRKPSLTHRAASEETSTSRKASIPDGIGHESDTSFEIDAKTLLIGDFAENGTWWTGKQTGPKQPSRNLPGRFKEAHNYEDQVTSHVRWDEIQAWYQLVLSAGQSWRTRWDNHAQSNDSLKGTFRLTEGLHSHITKQLSISRLHLHRHILRASETLLRRPCRPLKRPEDSSFLLILLANPLLYPQESMPAPNGSTIVKPKIVNQKAVTRMQMNGFSSPQPSSLDSTEVLKTQKPWQHAGIIKRILGLMANLSVNCHQHFMTWLAKLPKAQYRRIVDLIGSFVTHRLTRHLRRKHQGIYTSATDLVSGLPGAGSRSSSFPQTTVIRNDSAKASPSSDTIVSYSADWQIKAAAKVMSLLFAANHVSISRRRDTVDAPSVFKRRGQTLPTSHFYNSVLDHFDLMADFESWESKESDFCFCQYPMFLSIWAKIHIMEHDARRQMEIKAREAFFDSIVNRKAIKQHLVFKIRRGCLVEDSLRSMSEVIGAGQEEIKKGVRVEFVGEEGIDAGGLRKEWFLLLVREVFDPEHGLFVFDEESRYCYFNSNCFETSDQFFLVGVVLGLAIYNSTILDVALPPFAFRKLLASAPAYSGPVTSLSRPTSAYSLEDLAELKPTLAKGLAQLLAFEGNVEETFCRDFVAPVDRYGHISTIPLCTNGENRPVTNDNRREFVQLYLKYLLDTSVARQFEPFKRGFFTVCGGNALSLFRPEEIELLVRGSDEPLDVESLRLVAVYENWPRGADANVEPTVTWFWDMFAASDISFQRNILAFITGSDRIPAMGAMNLVIKITYLGSDHTRYPTARTCFNMLGLYGYLSREDLEAKLRRAVSDSEGFGLK